LRNCFKILAFQIITVTLLMPTEDSSSANAPKRERGRLRVAAIIKAAVEIFAEKGYDVATMTEIAARSGTAIGSLYRFFPSKEALADALLLQYAQHVKHALTELEQQVPHMKPDSVADALVDFMLALQSQRSFAVSLIDARGLEANERKRFREMMRGAIADIVRKTIPGVTPAKARVMAVVLLLMLKGLSGAMSEEPAARAMLIAEMRELVRMYLASAAGRKRA
jgi:AcrR family transcriptional regulator